MPMPTTDSFAMLSLYCTSPAPIFLATSLAVFNVFFRSFSGTVKDMSVYPVRLMFCIIMSMLIFASAIFLKMRAAMPGLSGTSHMVTFASSLFTVTPLTTISSIVLTSSEIIVPSLSEKLDLTCIFTLNFLATSIERG